jgi:hypothetical protein
VGPNHIVQWAGGHLAVFDKAGNPLIPGFGFLPENALWAGFGGVCETSFTGTGQPMVQYDRLADRWVYSRRANGWNAGRPVFPFAQCFAVSTSGDPLGTFNRYSYVFSESPDYTKLGIWPDAYYTSSNMFHAVNGNFTGVKPCAYNRSAMLAGADAPSICFPTGIYAGGASFLPSDWDGETPPPLGAPNIFMRYSTFGALRMIKFHVDFSTPANSTWNDGFGGATGSFVALPVTLTLPCGGFGGTCIPQLGTTNQLVTVGDRLMYRLQYRKRGTTESLVVNQSEDPPGPAVSGLRWYEIRNPFGTTPSLFQNATYQPDSLNRWMGSMAMDKAGNLAIGYSVSSATMNPAIRITGRLRSEVRNQLQAETTIINGTGSQTDFDNIRISDWGYQSAMQLDPIDDCTFWFTTEYFAENGFNWRTKIASFRFAGCQ